MVIACRREDGETEYERFHAASLLPEDIMKEERFLVFYPMHYKTRSIGYLAMNDISAAAQLNLHENLFSFLEIAVENVRKKGLLRRLNERLDHLYVMDRLTGLFNRDYFYRYAEQYDLFHAEEPTDALVLDISHFHMINERFGKAYGDEILRRIGAELLRMASRSAGRRIL